MKKLILMICALAFLSLTISEDANAKQTRRDGKWEASFQLLNSQSADINGEKGTGIEIEDDIGWGFTLGYNINPHILVNFEFASTTPRYDATLIDEDDESYSVKHKMDLYHSQFNVVYNFLTEQFTPYVQAGAGWSYIDSNIASGPPTTVCWWDPWWGRYVCDGYQNTYNDTRFSYNIAAGVRYELDNSLFFRASYQQSWVDLSNSSDLSIGSVHLEIGSIF